MILLHTQNHLAGSGGELSGRRLEKVQSNMAGIQNSILNINNNNTKTIMELR